MYLGKYIFTALETGRKAISLWQALLVCFAASANKNYFYQQCMHIVLILSKSPKQLPKFTEKIW